MLRCDAVVRFFAVMFDRATPPLQILLLMKQKNVKMSLCECFQWCVENNKGLNISLLTLTLKFSLSYSQELEASRHFAENEQILLNAILTLGMDIKKSS